MKKGFKVLLIIIISLGGLFGGYSVFYFISEDPLFELPLNNAMNVTTGIQTFHEGSGTHGGFDFELRNNTEIISPVDGVVSSVEKHKMFNDLWIIDVWIDINLKWATFIAFEPCTYDESVIDEQMSYITVKAGDRVQVGGKLGNLTPVNNSEFPHIHWNVIAKWIIQVGPGTDMSPYDYCSADARAVIDQLCAKFGKPPSYD
jgi:murein DD-endopeptidase MepM/ murein hydrolase activator NlpD